MKKDWTRDYTTAIFRTWAAAGRPSYEAERERIYNRALMRNVLSSAEEANAKAAKAVEDASSYLMDILAAEETMKMLAMGNKEHIARAVEAVYFVAPAEPLRRGDVIARVRRFAVELPADEATVFRWLKEARLLCAAARGLRIGDKDLKKYNVQVVRSKKKI